LSVRGTYGTSFRAPLLYSLSESADPPGAIILGIDDPAAADGTSVIYYVGGNNPNLRAEEATFWTAGVDWRPQAAGGLAASLTYFRIDYSDRIIAPFPDTIFNALLNESVYASVIQRNPPLELLETWPIGFNPDELALTDVDVFFDNRVNNLATTHESGLDLTLDYALDTSLGRFTFQVAGTYLLEKENQVAPSAPFVKTYNGVALPVDLKLRNSVNWSRGGWSSTLFVNYIDSYENNQVGFTGQSVSSWTTADVTVLYDFGAVTNGVLSGLSASLAAINVTGEDPPHVGSPFNIGFDPTNANATGRSFTLGITQRW
jgi:iron complex outermembrane recepter protein